MIKRHRELAELAARAGLQVVSITPGKSGNKRVIAMAPNGVEKTFFFASTPSDRRGDQNGESFMRRFARDNPAPHAAPPLGSAMAQALHAAVTTKVAVEPPAAPPAAPPQPTPVEPQEAEKEEPVTDKTTPETKPRAKRQQLDFKEFYAVCEAIKGFDMTGVSTYVQVMRMVQEKTGIRITDYSARNALEAVGMKLDRPAPQGAVDMSDFVYLAELLAQHFEDIGTAVPERLAKLAGR